SRILAPNGFMIIREHDDDHSTMFKVYIELVHSFWYISKNESVDSLYLLSNFELVQMFKEHSLLSVKFDSYNHDNPQRIYHEVFQKVNYNSEPGKIFFKDEQAEKYFKRYIKLLKTKSVDRRLSLIPKRFRDQLRDKYGEFTSLNEELTWQSI